MVEPVTDVGVGLEVEHRVAAAHRLFECLGVQHVALDERRVRALQQVGQELAPAGAEIVEDHDLDAVGGEPVGERAADEPGPAGNERSFHGDQSVKPAAIASRRNI